MTRLFVNLCAGLMLAGTVHAADAKLPKLLDMGASKCIPCRKMAPILEELKRDYAGKFTTEFVDVWQPENAAKGEEHKIRLIPTQIFFDAAGKELWRHEGFLSKEAILMKWEELGVTVREKPSVAERWQPAQPDKRSKEDICYLCDGTIEPKSLVRVKSPKGDVRLCSVHCYFIVDSCLTEDKTGFEDRVEVTDAATGKPIALTKSVYLVGADAKTGRPWIKPFADRAAAEQERGGTVLTFAQLKVKELATRCGFCDRAVYPEDAALVKARPGIHTFGCCAHCALGVAARLGTDIEVHQPDALTGEMIVINTMNGCVESVQPPTAVAWFGQRTKPDGTRASAGCFHQGNFVNADNLRKWLEAHPLETGSQITIEKALADKMKLSPAQIQKACKIGECSPK